MNKTETKTIEAIATDKQSAKCAACGVVWSIWYVGEIAIARVYCKCECAPKGANRFGIAR